MIGDPSDSTNVRRHYDLVAGKYEEVFFDDLSDKRWLDLLLAYLPAGSSMIDVGCGPGNFGTYLQKRGILPVGIDLSLEMMRIGRQRRSVSCPFVQATMVGLPFKPGVFDGALVAYSLLHVSKDEVPIAMKEIRRVCRRGGCALFLVREGEGEGVMSSNLVSGETFFARLWPLQEIESVLVAAGWEIAYMERAEPATAEEIQHPKLALLVAAA